MKEFRVSKTFAADFSAVVMHYECPPDEIDLMKEAVRSDYANAATSFALMHQEIKWAGR